MDEAARFQDLIETHRRVIDVLAERRQFNIRKALVQASGVLVFSAGAWGSGALISPFYDHAVFPLLPLTLTVVLTSRIFGSAPAVVLAVANAYAMVWLSTRGTSMIVLECLGWLWLAAVVPQVMEIANLLDRWTGGSRPKRQAFRGFLSNLLKPVRIPSDVVAVGVLANKVASIPSR